MKVRDAQRLATGQHCVNRTVNTESGASSGRGQEHAAELARIVAAWDDLPAVLKGAMLAIVDSAGAAGLERVAGGSARNSS